MKRNDAEQIGDMIRKFFRLNGLESPLNEYRLCLLYTSDAVDEL